MQQHVKRGVMNVHLVQWIELKFWKIQTPTQSQNINTLKFTAGDAGWVILSIEL